MEWNPVHKWRPPLKPAALGLQIVWFHFNTCDNAAHISYDVNGSTRSNSFSFVVLFNKQD